MTPSESATGDSSLEVEEYDENVATLSKLMKGKNPPAAQAMKQLLDATRSIRVQWMKEFISIKDIFQKFPCLKVSKWVCVHMYMHLIISCLDRSW